MYSSPAMMGSTNNAIRKYGGSSSTLISSMSKTQGYCLLLRHQDGFHGTGGIGKERGSRMPVAEPVLSDEDKTAQNLTMSERTQNRN